MDPEQELTAWCEAQLISLRGNRALIRKTMSEMEERPELAPCACAGPQNATRQLRGYVQRLADEGRVDADCPVDAAAAMLLGVVFSDAMWRDTLPEICPQPAEEAARRYARLFLRAIGASPARVRHTSAERTA